MQRFIVKGDDDVVGDRDLESGESLGRVDSRGESVHVGTLALRHPALPAAAFPSDGTAARVKPALDVDGDASRHGDVAHSLALDRILREQRARDALLERDRRGILERGGVGEIAELRHKRGRARRLGLRRLFPNRLDCVSLRRRRRFLHRGGDSLGVLRHGVADLRALHSRHHGGVHGALEPGHGLLQVSAVERVARVHLRLNRLRRLKRRRRCTLGRAHDTSHALRDAFLGEEDKVGRVGGVREVRTAAELDGVSLPVLGVRSRE